MSEATGTSHLTVYNKVILILSVLTALEFGIAAGVPKPEVTGSGFLPFGIAVVVLVALAAVKAVFVGRVFMHLKYDAKVLSWIAVAPVVLATPLILLVCYDGIFKYGG